MKLMLGTVQFGLAYGVTNLYGQTSKEQISKILSFCNNSGINYLDTAYSYGEAEILLGGFKEYLPHFNIVTKLASLQKLEMSVQESFSQSLENLRVENVHGLLFHNSADLFSKKGEEYFDDALKLKSENKVKKIGVSVYSPQELISLLDNYEIEIVQIPINIFDQRFLEGDLLKKMKARNIEIHARSVFLQGLLLEKPHNINPFFADVRSNLVHFNKVAQELKVEPIELLLSFVNNINEIDQFAIGVNSLEHLIEVFLCLGKKINCDFSQFKIENENYLLPMNWKLI